MHVHTCSHTLQGFSREDWENTRLSHANLKQASHLQPEAESTSSYSTSVSMSDWNPKFDQGQGRRTTKRQEPEEHLPSIDARIRKR